MSLQTPAQVTFHQTEHSDSLEADIRDKIDELAALYDGVVSCRVVVEHEHFDREEQGPVAVRFELGLSGGKRIVGGGTGTHNDEHADASAAARAAFEATKRQLRDYVDRRRAV